MRRIIIMLVLASATVAHAQDAATQQLLQEADKYYDQGEYERAASNYDRAIRSQPRDVPPGAYAKRASIYLFEKKYDEGLHWISEVAEPSWPDDDAILEQKAVVLSRMPDRKKESVELAEKVLKRKPALYTLSILLGDFYFQLGSGAAEKTVVYYETYLKNRPSDLAAKDGLVRVKLGFGFLYLGRFAEAERQFDEALRAFGNDTNIAANARKGLCAAYTGEKNWDKALAQCERVLKDKKALRGDASPQYNAGLAYLNRDRLDDAMKSADAFIAVKPHEPKGYLLRGEVFYRKNRFPDAEQQYGLAEQYGPNDAEVARELGKVYLKQKKAPKAIEKLSRAIIAVPGDLDTVEALSEAYIADGQGTNAVTTAEKGQKLPGQEKNTRLMTLAGEGYYVANQLAPARAALEKSLAMSKAAGAPDARARTLLVDTINRQAAARLNADDAAGAEKLLLEARDLDPDSTRTNYNLGVLSVDKGKFEDAIKYLSVRLSRTPTDLLTNRVIAKAYLNLGNTDKAAEHYAKAAAEATTRRNQAALAEVYTEWAPLLIKAGKLDEAVDKLEQAAQAAAGQPFEKATRRNLQLAYFKRGMERLHARRGADAANDLEYASREPALLVGTEEDAFNFALGIAYLESGQPARAGAIFGNFLKRGGNLAFLKSPWEGLGAEFFAAYALYRDPSPQSRLRAQGILDHLAGRTGGAINLKVREMARSIWEQAAFDAYARGDGKEADADLKKADAASADKRAAVQANQAAMDLERGAQSARAALKSVSDRVPEALVNLGILADRDGDSKAAYDLWTSAKAKGARGPHLDEWIEAKKKLFGYGQ